MHVVYGRTITIITLSQGARLCEMVHGIHHYNFKAKAEGTHNPAPPVNTPLFVVVVVVVVTKISCIMMVVLMIVMTVNVIATNRTTQLSTIGT